MGTKFIVDATAEEEACNGVKVVVGVNKKGNVCSVQMSGRGGGVDTTSLYEMLQVLLIGLFLALVSNNIHPHIQK